VTAEGEPETESSGETVPAAESEPAFDFAEDIQRTVYVRDGSWLELQDAINFEVKRVLASHDLRDDSLFKREVQDAMVRAAANHPEEIAQYILADRQIIDEPAVDGDE
jgi:hypothetical protein